MLGCREGSFKGRVFLERMEGFDKAEVQRRRVGGVTDSRVKDLRVAVSRCHATSDSTWHAQGSKQVTATPASR